MIHRPLADTHIIRFDSRTGDVHHALTNHIHHLPRRHLRRLATRAHTHIGDPTEHRVTFLIQLLPTGVGVSVQHRTATATIGAFHGLGRISVQVDDATAAIDVFGKGRLRGRRHRSATAQGEDAVEILQHVGDKIGLDLAERRFAFALEKLGDAHAYVMLNLHVGIGERQIHDMGDFLADTGLSRAHHADNDGNRNGMTNAAHCICSGQEAR